MCNANKPITSICDANTPITGICNANTPITDICNANTPVTSQCNANTPITCPCNTNALSCLCVREDSKSSSYCQHIDRTFTNQGNILCLVVVGRGVGHYGYQKIGPSSNVKRKNRFLLATDVIP